MTNRITLFVSFNIMIIAILAIGLLVFFVGKKRNQPKHLSWLAFICIAMGITSLFDLVFQIKSRVSELSVLSTAVFGFIIINSAQKHSETLYRIACGSYILACVASVVITFARQCPTMEALKIGLPLAIGLNAKSGDGQRPLQRFQNKKP